MRRTLNRPDRTGWTPHRFDPNESTLGFAEASRIAENARRGLLDLSDPNIRDVVGDARQIVVRTRMWGEIPERQDRRVRRLLTAGITVVGCIITASVVGPLLTGR